MLDENKINYDHLLTRVYDKQEKKMLYPLQNEFIDDEYNLLACNATHLITRSISRDNVQTYIPYKDRFIPMLCAAYKDTNEKLIYEHDIIKTPCAEYVIERYQGMFIAEHINDYFSLDDVITQLKNTNIQIKISGNIHENLNPLNQKEEDNDKRSPKKTKSS